MSINVEKKLVNPSQTEICSLKKENELLCSILNSIPEIILAKDWDGNFIFANETIAKLYNTTPEKMLGLDDVAFTGNEEQTEFFRQNIQDIMQRFQPETVYEDSMDAKTGEIRHFQSIKTPFRDSQNNLNIAVIAKDVTDITRLKNNAENDHKLLNYVLDATQEGTWDWNLNNDNISHNVKWGVISGLKQTESTLEEFFNCIHPDDMSFVEEKIQGALDNHTDFDCKYRFLHPDGKNVWVQDRGQVVEWGEDGEPKRMVGAVNDISQHVKQQKRIEELAFFDPLTKLPNRRMFDERLRQAIQYHKLHNLYGAVLFLDLDHFKMLNDIHGHLMGDQLLLSVSECLQDVLKNDDVVARFGGDEFVVILNSLAEEETSAGILASNIALRLRDAISKPTSLQKKASQDSLQYEVTTSIGGVIFPSDADQADLLLQLADMALYRAKEQGRDSFVIYDPIMQKELDHAIQLEKDLKFAIQNQQLELYYQPKYNTDLKFFGVEALVRWHCPQRGFVMPGEFITIAEESNLILSLGCWVIEKACFQLQQWRQLESFKEISISVNVSSKQIWEDSFVDDLINTVNKYDFNFQNLTLEITESVLLRDLEVTILKLNKLKSAGIKIALDDFGTGYSSLSYLKRLPVDEIKIDGSFVRDIVDDYSDFMMTKAIVDIGHNFNVNVVAEGVETAEQLACLKSMGNLSYQGYLFSPPVPIAKLETLPQ